MAFTLRSIAAPDLEGLFPILREKFILKPADRSGFLSLWRELLEKNACISVAVEDRRLAPGKRLVGFGMSVFVTDAFARRVNDEGPFLSRLFLREWAGGNRPYLLKPEVAAANAGEGLNLMVLHYGWREEALAPADLAAVRLKQTESFLQQHAGYKVKEYLQEVFGEELRDFVLTAGSLLRQDYQEARWKKPLRGVSKGDWPYLTGFRAEEILARAGTTASMLQARAQPPRFALAPSEQDMLSKALQGETDEKLSRSLKVSPWTIKKRWQSVYLKVRKADPDLLENNGPEKKNEQRRRYLLDYLRQHPEELRPRSSPRR
ncbi:MAG TPA: hypothetical protein VMU88_03505 [bacterium]|nr:hypothetical protein [bacterium]